MTLCNVFGIVNMFCLCFWHGLDMIFVYVFECLSNPANSFFEVFGTLVGTTQQVCCDASANVLRICSLFLLSQLQEGQLCCNYAEQLVDIATFTT